MHLYHNPNKVLLHRLIVVEGLKNATLKSQPIWVNILKSHTSKMILKYFLKEHPQHKNIIMPLISFGHPTNWFWLLPKLCPNPKNEGEANLWRRKIKETCWKFWLLETKKTIHDAKHYIKELRRLHIFFLSLYLAA